MSEYPAPAPAPQSGELIQFNVTAVDATGALITKPLVIRIDAGLSGTVRRTNPANFYNGPPLDPPWLGDIEVSADGYAPYTTGADPQITFKDHTVNFAAVLQPSFKRPPNPVTPVIRGALPPFSEPYTLPYIPGMDVLPWPITDPVRATDTVSSAFALQPSSRLRPWRNPHAQQLSSATPSTAPRERDYLRADSWGVTIPGAPWVPGASHTYYERILSWFVDRYPPDWQQKYLETYAGYGYTHLRLSYADSCGPVDNGPHSPPGNAQSLEQLIETCHLVKRYVPYVRMMIGSKYFQPGNMSAQQWADFSDPIIDQLIAAKAVDEITLGWEWNLWNEPGETTINAFRHCGQRAHAAGLSSWMHFSSHVTSWFKDGDPRGRFGFYDDLHNDVNGIDYQTDPSWSMEETQARLVDTLWQFGERGNDYKMRFDEDMAMPMFDHDRPNEDDANARCYLACCTVDNVKWTTARIWGFGNGARMPDGSQL